MIKYPLRIWADAEAQWKWVPEGSATSEDISLIQEITVLPSSQAWLLRRPDFT